MTHKTEEAQAPVLPSPPSLPTAETPPEGAPKAASEKPELFKTSGIPDKVKEDILKFEKPSGFPSLAEALMALRGASVGINVVYTELMRLNAQADQINRNVQQLRTQQQRVSNVRAGKDLSRTQENVPQMDRGRGRVA
ncbi:MAG: hypothetical protein LBU87_07130 [Lactobacillales bacterium]|jgi:hypothetical protein|nr:hypothetical protein [Lactobacillales bacterium]